MTDQNDALPATRLDALERDSEGYLKHLNDWNEEIAHLLAHAEQIDLTDAHWEVLRLVKAFYLKYDHCPNNRVLVKQLRMHLGEEKGTSLYLMKLFPDAPAKKAAKIAGLPRPTHCL